jgi:hypothetical protein
LINIRTPSAWMMLLDPSQLPVAGSPCTDWQLKLYRVAAERCTGWQGPLYSACGAAISSSLSVADNYLLLEHNVDGGQVYGVSS